MQENVVPGSRFVNVFMAGGIMRHLVEVQNRHAFGVSLVVANALSREGLRRILEEEGITVAAYEHPEALIKARARNHSSDMVVIDCDDLADARREIAGLVNAIGEAQIVLLASRFDLELIVNAFKSGADGFIMKEISCGSLLGSLHLVAMGEKIMPSRMVDHLPQIIGHDAISQQPRLDTIELLSEREKETLCCLVSGYANKVITRRMDISEATVKVHVKAILRKLSVQNRTQAAIWAVNNGLVPGHLEPFGDESESAIPLRPDAEPNVLQLQS